MVYVVKVVRNDMTSLYAPPCVRQTYALGKRSEGTQHLPLFAYRATGNPVHYAEWNPGVRYTRLLLCEAYGDLITRPPILSMGFFHQSMTTDKFIAEFLRHQESNGQEYSVGCLALMPVLDITDNPTRLNPWLG